MQLYHEYEKRMKEARDSFEIENSFSQIFNTTDKKSYVSFFIYFSAYGVSMTEPVESWIKRAGQACVKLGYKTIGESLISHSKEEAGHDKLMIGDLKNLIKIWNKNYDPKIEVKDFLDIKSTNGAEEYANLHESTISSPSPYCQVAIEFEIEKLSIVYGPKLIENFHTLLGKDAKGMRFIKDHADFDIHHTNFNQKLISEVLETIPNSLEQLVDAGEKALKTYCKFTNECLSSSKKLL